VWVPEFAREYALQKKNELTLEDVELIARGQIAGEDLGAERASKLLILDTDLISTVVYSRHYYSRVPLWIEKEARRRRADLYLLMNVDLPWKADAARDRPKGRKKMLQQFEKALRELEARYELISGGMRLRDAIGVIDQFAVRG
jgi:nicotinamide riboside kinase